MAAKLVIFRDERNVAVKDGTYELDGGYSVGDLPLLIARKDDHNGKPEDFRVLLVFDATGDATHDEARLLMGHAHLFEEDAVRLRAIVAYGTGPIAQDLRRDGIDDEWIRRNYDDEARRLRAEAVEMLP